MFHMGFIMLFGGVMCMDKENKTYSMSIRVSQEELNKLKQAARLESYGSYSEFVRRTSLIEADKVISDKKRENNHDNS